MGHLKNIYSLLMEGCDWVLQNVAAVYFFPFPDHIRMFPHHQPSDVRIEESPFRVVRIRVRFRVFVVNSVILDPLQNGILQE